MSALRRSDALGLCLLGRYLPSVLSTLYASCVSGNDSYQGR